MILNESPLKRGGYMLRTYMYPEASFILHHSQKIISFTRWKLKAELIALFQLKSLLE